MNTNSPLTSSPALAWFFVTVWGCGYLATKTGLPYAPPFTFLSLRFALGILALIPLAFWWNRREPLRFPSGAIEWWHVIFVGILMHAVNLAACFYAQYLGMSAGVTALVLAAQPLVTALVAAAFMRERLRIFQWTGVLVGLLGVALVVWHKLDMRALSWSAFLAAVIGLTSITTATLYQRAFCRGIDLRAASLIQIPIAFIVLTPLAVAIDGYRFDASWPLFGAIAYLVVLSSIFAVNALHTLMRRGEVTRVSSLLYLTPIFAVVLEWLMFAVVPTYLTLVGIVVTCAGVALVAWTPGVRRA